jgi:hypothetical protein
MQKWLMLPFLSSTYKFVITYDLYVFQYASKISLTFTSLQIRQKGFPSSYPHFIIPSLLQ